MTAVARCLVCLGLFLASAESNAQQPPESSGQHFTGTISPSCGPTDGVASFVTLKPRKTGPKFLSIFVDGFEPEGLHGTIQTVADGYPKLTISSCDSEDLSSCTNQTNATATARITISRNSHDSVEGIVRFKNANKGWNEASFTARIVTPPGRKRSCP